MTLLRLSPVAVEAIARQLRITHHTTGATSPWVPNDEQIACWRACHDHRRVYAAKPRQVGVTSSTELDDLLWCKVNDAAGNRVRCGLYVDVDKKLSERVEFARSVANQLSDVFGKVDINSERVVFPRGSVLEFGTGSGTSEGRSGSYQRLHLSELPFWKSTSTYGSLMPSLSLDGQLIIETTLDIAAPNGALARDLWRDERNSLHRLFFDVQSHEEYRSPPGDITDEQWLWAQDQGFTDRSAAAWWLAVALPDLCAGDVSRLMREYPQLESHMFATATGRFVPVTSRVVQHETTLVCGTQNVPCWRRFTETSGHLVLSVDTGKGVERDKSACVLLDGKDGAICAAFSSASLDAFEFAGVVAGLLRHYTKAPSVGLYGIRDPGILPTLIVESNGIGEAMILKLRELGCSVTEEWTDAESKPLVLTASRQAVCAGTLFGPKQLADECDDLHLDEQGNFKGKKDMLFACGIALQWLRLHPYQEVVRPPPPEMVFDAKSILKHHMKGARKGDGWR